MQRVLEATGFVTLVVLFWVIVAIVVAAILWWWQRRAIGRRALEAIPAEIRLQPDVERAWSDPVRADDLAKELSARGYSDAGVFTVRQLPGVRVGLWLARDRRAAAAVNDVAAAGVWLDLWAIDPQGESVTVSDSRETGLDQPPWRRVVKLPGSSVAEMLAALASAAPSEAIVIDADDLARLFEDEWKREVAWRSGRGVRRAEVAAVASRMPDRGGPW